MIKEKERNSESLPKRIIVAIEWEKTKEIATTVNLFLQNKEGKVASIKEDLITEDNYFNLNSSVEYYIRRKIVSPYQNKHFFDLKTNKIPNNIEKMSVALIIRKNSTGSQNFEKIKGLKVKIINADTKQEIAIYEPENYSSENSTVLVEFYRKNGWEFKVLVEGYKSQKELYQNFGIEEDKLWEIRREWALKIVKYDSWAFDRLSPDFCNDKEIVSAAAKHNWKTMFYASKELKNDRDVVMNAIKNNPKAFQYASERLRSDKEIALVAGKERLEYGKNNHIISFAGKDILDDKELMLEILSVNPWNFKYVSDRLKDDREFVIAIAKKYGKIFEFVSDRLKKDEELIFEMLFANNFSFYLIDESLRNDKDFIIKCLRKNSDIYKELSEKQRFDKEIAFEAIKENGELMQYSSSELKKSKDFLQKIEQMSALKYISEELKNDPAFFLPMIEKNPEAFEYAGESIKNKREVVMQVVQKNGEMLQFVKDDKLKNDRDIALAAVKNNGNALKSLSEDLVQDAEIVSEALKSNGNALKFAAPKFRGNPDFVKMALRTSGLALEYGDEEIKSNFEIVAEAVKKNGFALYYADEKLRENPSLVEQAFKQYESIANLPYPQESKGTKFSYTENINTRNYEEFYIFFEIEERGFAFDSLAKILGIEQFSKIIDNMDFENGAGDVLVFVSPFDHNVLIYFDLYIGISVQNYHMGMGVRTPLNRVKYVKPIFEAIYLERYRYEDEKPEPNIKDKKSISKILSFDSYPVKIKDEDNYSYSQNIEFYMDSKLLLTSKEKYHNNRKLVMENLEYNPEVLKYAGEAICSDRDLILTAVKRFPFTLKYATEKLKNDKEIVRAAYKNDARVIAYIGEELKSDKEFILNLEKEYTKNDITEKAEYEERMFYLSRYDKEEFKGDLSDYFKVQYNNENDENDEFGENDIKDENEYKELKTPKFISPKKYIKAPKITIKEDDTFSVYAKENEKFHYVSLDVVRIANGKKLIWDLIEGYDKYVVYRAEISTENMSCEELIAYSNQKEKNSTKAIKIYGKKDKDGNEFIPIAVVKGSSFVDDDIREQHIYFYVGLGYILLT